MSQPLRPYPVTALAAFPTVTLAIVAVPVSRSIPGLAFLLSPSSESGAHRFIGFHPEPIRDILRMPQEFYDEVSNKLVRAAGEPDVLLAPDAAMIAARPHQENEERHGPSGWM
jgi:hypothetical protein